MKTCMPFCLLSVVFLVAGCRSTGAPSSDISALQESPEVPISEFKPLTFVDKPELQEGTGPMDAGDLPEFTMTDSGLKYRILRQSNGEKPTADSTVTVHYRGWLNNGKVFDSSYERGEATTFPLGNVIAAWTEGMQLVGQGGMIELAVPSRLGYGAQGSPGSIPPHSSLHFIVELVDVN